METATGILATAALTALVALGTSAYSRRMFLRSTLARVGICVLVCAASACGGAQQATPPATGGNPAPVGSAARVANRCPITADQVSTALGSKVLRPDESVCMFYPGEDPTVVPNVLFVRQVPFVCNGTMPADAGYKEQVSGLGPAAYVADRGDGLHLLVCQGQTPFDLRVNASTPELRREAAIALARHALSGS